MIGGKYTRDAKIGNTVLKPGVNLKQILGLLLSIFHCRKDCSL